MTLSEYQLFLSIGMGLCGLMVLVNLMRVGSRGASAYVMASAFAVAGGGLYLVMIEAPRPALYASAALLAALLIVDVAIRSYQGHNRP
ncbi:MAG TPA: hypothetical protein VM328_04245 [Fimbriimonadaceae bacterium]|nr:hypothetical protein [Fimbriimonadaceae bacterium]